jgi:hypothetical protein
MSLFTDNYRNFNSDDVVSGVVEYQKYVAPKYIDADVVTWLFNLKTRSVSIGISVKYPLDVTEDYLTNTICIRENGEDVDIRTIEIEVERIFSTYLDPVDQSGYLEKIEAINTLTYSEHVEIAQDDSSGVKQWRCTRNAMYPVGTIGYFDLSRRVSHYIYAYNAFGAMVQMSHLYPHDVTGFTVTLA